MRSAHGSEFGRWWAVRVVRRVLRLRHLWIHSVAVLTRTRFAQPATASAPAAPIQVARSFLLAPKRPTFCESPAFCGKKPPHRPPSSPNSPQKPQFRHATPRRHFLLAPTLPPSVPYYPSPKPNPPPGPATAVPMPTSNTGNLPPPNPLTCPPIPLKPPPKPCPRPPFSTTTRPMPYWN